MKAMDFITVCGQSVQRTIFKLLKRRGVINMLITPLLLYFYL